MIALLLACAARAPVAVGPPVEVTSAFRLEARGRTLAGTAVVAVGDADWALYGLGPGGMALFTVSEVAGEVRATAPDPRMAEVLTRMPVERDLWLLYRWSCADRCRAEGGTLTRDGDRLSWRGRGGPAEVVREDGRQVLSDPRRGYTLTVVAP